jgi:TonB family protein
MQARATTKPLDLLAATLLALLLHVPILLAVGLAATRAPEPVAPIPTSDAIAIVEEPDPLEDPEDAQVVSLDKPELQTPPPDEAKFLDRYDQKVDQETIRKRDAGTPGSAAAVPQAERTPTRLAPAQQPSNPSQGQDKPSALKPDEQLVGADLAPKDDKGDQPADQTPTQDPNPSRVAENPATSPTPGQDKEPGTKEPTDGKGSPLESKNLFPTLDNALGDGGGETRDWLDVEEGDKDLLNRKQTRYWAFFDRLKGAVSREWKPNDAYRVHDPRRQVFGVEDRLTILHVTLSGDGAIQKLYVEKPCGAEFLDDEAVRAFRAAGPFPNPPEGLKNDDGHISLRFGFLVDVETQGSRIIRFRR